MTTARDETAKYLRGWLEVWANADGDDETADDMLEIWLNRALHFHGAPSFRGIHAMVIPSPELAAVLYDDEPRTGFGRIGATPAVIRLGKLFEGIAQDKT